MCLFGLFARLDYFGYFHGSPISQSMCLKSSKRLFCPKFQEVVQNPKIKVHWNYKFQKWSVSTFYRTRHSLALGKFFLITESKCLLSKYLVLQQLKAASWKVFPNNTIYNSSELDMVLVCQSEQGRRNFNCDIVCLITS